MKELLFLFVLFVSNVIQAITGFAGTGIGDAALRLFAWAGSCKGGPECYGLAVRTDDRSDWISTYKLERIA